MFPCLEVHTLNIGRSQYWKRYILSIDLGKNRVFCGEKMGESYPGVAFVQGQRMT